MILQQVSTTHEYIFFAGIWAYSQNEFSDSECPNLGNLGAVNDLEGCMHACVEKPNCTALNYNAATTHCTLRGCKFPITAPNNNRWDHFGYWRFSLSSSGRCRWTKTKTRNILGRALLDKPCDIFSAHMQQCCSWGEQALQRDRRLWEEAHWGHCYCRRVPWTLPATTSVP